LKVSIENFQSIKNAQIDVEKFTVLVGKNNRGKSATTRAIRSVIKNRGDFTRRDAKYSLVTLETDQFKISRVKGATVNNYEVNGKVYEKVGKDVPQEVIDLGFKPITIGKDKVYVQFPNQFEKIFLLDQPNAVVAETISKISRIDAVNNALKLAGKDRKQNESLVKVRVDDLEHLKKKLTNYIKVADLNLKAEQITAFDTKIQRLELDLNDLKFFIDQIDLAALKIKLFSKEDTAKLPKENLFLTLFEDLGIILKFKSNFEKKTQTICYLEKVNLIKIVSFKLEDYFLFNEIVSFVRSLITFKASLNALKKIEEVFLPDTSSLLNQQNTFTEASIYLDKCLKLSENISGIQKQLDQVSIDLKELDIEIQSLKQTEICPLKDIFGCKTSW